MLSIGDQMLLKVASHAIWETYRLAATLDLDRAG